MSDYCPKTTGHCTIEYPQCYLYISAPCISRGSNAFEMYLMPLGTVSLDWNAQFEILKSGLYLRELKCTWISNNYVMGDVLYRATKFCKWQMIRLSMCAKYFICCICTFHFLSLFLTISGFFVPFIYLPDFVENNGIPREHAAWLVCIIGKISYWSL